MNPKKLLNKVNNFLLKEVKINSIVIIILIFLIFMLGTVFGGVWYQENTNMKYLEQFCIRDNGLNEKFIQEGEHAGFIRFVEWKYNNTNGISIQCKQIRGVYYKKEVINLIKYNNETR